MIHRIITDFGPLRSTFDETSFRYQPGQPCIVVEEDDKGGLVVVVLPIMEKGRIGVGTRMTVPREHVGWLQ